MSNDSKQSPLTNSQRHEVTTFAPRTYRRSMGCAAAVLAAITMVAAAGPAEASSYTLFETGQVRPLALSPNGTKLYAVNTPDNRLEVFHVTGTGLVHEGSVTVGLEPIAVAARNNNEVWVVNHLSDSVSVVDTTVPMAPRVVRTLLVADEPRDIVFAGPGKNRAFITTAHRGQNAPYDPQFATPGIGRADVWVFDADNLGASTLGGSPLTILSLFSDTPRSLAVTPDGTRVYAAGFHSGNKTSVVHRSFLEVDPNYPPPLTDYTGAAQPSTERIVKYNGEHWVDDEGYVLDNGIKFNLPDKDVFVIDATANPPAQLAGNSGFYTGVGTILFNMAVNPANGKVYVTNTEANNFTRFAGPGDFAGSTVKGHLHETRISVLSPGGTVAPRHLNKHIDYNVTPSPAGVQEKSLAIPTEMAITANGSTLYVAAFGSSKIGVFNTAALENDTFVPNAASHIVLDDAGSPVGPSGLVLDESQGRLYVLTRFDNSVAIVDTASKTVTARLPLYNPEPASVTHGRQFLYDARFTSSNGEASCASCHVFGDFDSLAWDLGNPDATTEPFIGPRVPFPLFGDVFDSFPSLKGPKTTQSLRGLANHGPMHWRGDRTKGDEEPSAQPDSGTFNEVGAFTEFQEAFSNLMGRSGPIPDDDMAAFTDFALQIMYPPNPIRNLDNALTAFQQGGKDHMDTLGTDANLACSTCHVLDHDANAEYGVPIPGFFGTDGRSVVGINPQPIKIPHLRNVYQKVGMFGFPEVFNHLSRDGNPHMGDQVRGFGMLNHGAEDTVFRFMLGIGFDLLSGFPPNGFDDRPGGDGDVKRRQVEAFVMAFDTNLAPIVGQQVTLDNDNLSAANDRLDLLLQRADAGECDVIAKMRVATDELGFLYVGANQFVSSKQSIGTVTRATLTADAQGPHGAVTFTAVPPGTGERIGIDRDEDGTLDNDE